MKLGDKYAKQYGYVPYVGADITPVRDIIVDVAGEYTTLKRVTMRVKDVPFPVHLDVHPEDIIETGK